MRLQPMKSQKTRRYDDGELEVIRGRKFKGEERKKQRAHKKAFRDSY